MTATAARTNLYNLIDKTNNFHEPIIISGKRNNIQHRLVYEIFEKEKVVRILRIRTHYE